MRNKSQIIQRLSREDAKARDEMVLIIRRINRWKDTIIARCFHIATEQIYRIKKLDKILKDSQKVD